MHINVENLIRITMYSCGGFFSLLPLHSRIRMSLLRRCLSILGIILLFLGLLGSFQGFGKQIWVWIKMDELSQSWNRLTLSDREGSGCCLLDEEKVENFSIAVKFLTRQAINMEIITKTFTSLWRARNDFKIQSFWDHKILFSFDNKEDVDRILEGEPWSFDKHLVVMSRYENESPLEDIQFEKTKLWV